MAVYYVDNDVGLSGGSGTSGDPFGIEDAIATFKDSGGDDIFYWRGGSVVDIAPGHTLDFNSGGNTAGPVRWVGCANDWTPLTPADPITVGVNAAGGSYHAVTVSAGYQVFSGIRAHNTLNGPSGTKAAWNVSGDKNQFRHCLAYDCLYGFYSDEEMTALVQCAVNAAGTGVYMTRPGVLVCALAANNIDADAVYLLRGGAVIGLRAWDIGAAGVHLDRDDAVAYELLVDHASVHDCVDGVKIASAANINAAVVINSAFDTCSGYAVNVTAPNGQLVTVLSNAGYALTSGQVPAGRLGLINEGWVAPAASPFVDAANGDFNLVRSTPLRGAALDGGDIGALQRPWERLPHPLRG